MTKLESYQVGGSFAATKFYADIVGAPGEETVDRALEELAFQTKSLTLLGTYPMARVRGCRQPPRAASSVAVARLWTRYSVTRVVATTGPTRTNAKKLKPGNTPTTTHRTHP